METESSVVDYMRNTFANDKALMEVLDVTSKNKGIYEDLSPLRKKLLYSYPQGVLYKEYSSDDENFVLVSDNELLNQIAEYSSDNNVALMNNLSEVANYLDDYLFENVIRDIHLDYIDD